MVEPKRTLNDVYVIVPTTIPGLNKEKISTLIQKACENQGYEYHDISIKDVKINIDSKVETKGLDPKGNKIDTRVVQKLSLREFYRKFEITLDEVLLDKSLSNPVFFFLHKTHPQNSWKRLESFKFASRGKYKIGYIALTARYTIDDRLTLNKQQYPFDADFVLNCLWWILNRDVAYETVTGTNAQKLSTVGTFVGKYRGLDIGKEGPFNALFELNFFDKELNQSKIEQAETFFQLFGDAIDEQAETIKKRRARMSGVPIEANGEDIAWNKRGQDLVDLYNALNWKYALKSDTELLDKITIGLNSIIQKIPCGFISPPDVQSSHIDTLH